MNSDIPTRTSSKSVTSKSSRRVKRCDTRHIENSSIENYDAPDFEDQVTTANNKLGYLREVYSVDVFYFVNPSSGGNQAASFNNSGIKNWNSVIMHQGRERDLKVHFFDMTDGSDGDRPGYHELKKSVDSNAHVVACACGGDGSVVWMTTEIHKHKIDDSKLIYAIIPYGTGNDFARTFGWEWANALQPFDMIGPLGNKTMKINKLMEQWFAATPCLTDVWEIELKLRDGGELIQVKGADRKKIPVETRTFKMINYFSVGIDARIGLGFDKNRTTTQLGNKMVYINEGTKKLFKKDFISIDKWVDSFEHNGEKVIGDGEAEFSLLSGTKSLMALNVNSYGGGRDLWSHARKVGVSYANTAESRKKILKLKESNQKMGDRRLEWATCLHRSSLGLEQLGHGHTRRAYHGDGTFKLNMDPEAKATDRCYFQVDGEFYQCNMPDYFTVRHLKQMTVLTNMGANFVSEKTLVLS